MIRSFRALSNVFPGFVQPNNVLTLKISIPAAEVEDPVQTARTHERILRRVEQIAGVSSVGLSTSITMDGWDSNDSIHVEEFPIPEGQVPPIRRFKTDLGETFRNNGKSHPRRAASHVERHL